MPAELSTPQVAPFAVTRHWSSQLDDQATTAQSLLGPPATFKDNPGPAYIWRSDDRDRNIGALHLGHQLRAGQGERRAASEAWVSLTTPSTRRCSLSARSFPIQ